MSLNSTHAEMYSIQHYVIKSVSDLRQVGVFFLGIPVSSTDETGLYDITDILLKVVLKTTALSIIPQNYFNPNNEHLRGPNLAVSIK